MTAYLVCVWLHVLAAATWIGSMIFFATVVVPVARRRELRTGAPALMRLVGARFRILGWITLGLLLVTGLGNLTLRGLTWSDLRTPAFWSLGFGHLLAWKLSFVGLVVVLSVLHEIAAGRQAMDALERDPDSARAKRVRRAASLLGRAMAITSLVILFLAVAMTRGFFG
jgi:copper resistance protein D